MTHTVTGAVRRAALVLAALLAVQPLFPLTVAKVGLEKMTRDARLVVRGIVLSSESRWEGRNILTRTRVRVLEALKGAAGDVVTVAQPGGTVGDITSQVAGAPQLVRNEEVVLFLTEWKGELWIHSIVLGKFSVARRDGVPVVVNDLGNVGLVDPVSGREITDPADQRSLFPLEDFLAQVRLLAQKEGRP
ncbi:MAG: hypothetical protein WB626_10400 [Bacteroidota bacterium]